MAQHIEGIHVAVKALTPLAHGRELSCMRLVFWSTAMATACLFANWLAVAN
ncbi:MAG: hypothetical protein ACSHXK_16000 [Oceanococcus sp.]